MEEEIEEGQPRVAVFTSDEWWLMRRAMFGSAVSVALAGYGNGRKMDAMFAVTQQLLAARSGSPSQLVRELADFSHFETGWRPGISRSEEEAWLTSRLKAIRSAVAAVVAKAPADAAAFRKFLLDLAYTPIGTRRWVSHAEATAIARIEDALAA
jgi:hypothetical protein